MGLPHDPATVLPPVYPFSSLPLRSLSLYSGAPVLLCSCAPTPVAAGQHRGHAAATISWTWGSATTPTPPSASPLRSLRSVCGWSVCGYITYSQTAWQK